ncbi:hypothetical protein [Paracoccus zhejiangensis]|nr:hypothetical protein [Paracoccus zhejiangensis]
MDDDLENVLSTQIDVIERWIENVIKQADRLAAMAKLLSYIPAIGPLCSI